MHALDLVSRNFREVGALRKILANEAVGVLIGASLPWAPRVGKVYLYSRIDGESFVSEHFFSLIVGKRFLEFCRQGTEGSGIRFPDGHCTLVPPEMNEKGVAGGAFDQGAQAGFPVQSQDEIAFPVSGNRAVGNFSWSLLNREHIGDFAAVSLHF